MTTFDDGSLSSARAPEGALRPRAPLDSRHDTALHGRNVLSAAAISAHASLSGVAGPVSVSALEHTDDPRCDDVEARDRLAAEAQLRLQKLEALGTLAGGIAHDFNNVLQAITGNTALAQRCLESDHPARPFLDEVATASARASDLVRRILTFSRCDEQQREVISLRSVVGEALKLVRATLPAQIGICADLSDDVPGVLGDATQIHQVIINLATNAAHAIGPVGGLIQVWLGTTQLETAGGPTRDLSAGTYAVLHLSDDGSGMDASTVARIFDPFFTTKPVGQGTGLGLSVVHGIMKGLGGAVTVRSERGTGTTFSLYFPTTRTKSEPTSRRTSAPSDPASGHVLFVDDEEVLVVLGTHILEVLGYQVTGLSRPLEALKVFANKPHEFNAVVTDLSMPGLSGFQLAQQLLALRSDVPIIMMSGFVGPDELANARRIGVRELLLKPVGMDDLNRSLSRVLGARPPKPRVHKS